MQWSNNSMKIQLKNLNSVPAKYQSVFYRAANKLAKVIVGTTSGHPKKMVITVNVKPIDNKDGVLAYAGPTSCHPNACYTGTKDLPAESEMVFDLDDLKPLATTKTLESTVLHEMLHAFGLGVHWESRGLITGAGTATPEYTGKHALREFQNLKNDTTITTIPLENDGGEGTRDAHWEQTTFGSEVFIGHITGQYQPLSRVTIGALEDLGYVVDYQQADTYSLPSIRKVSVEMAAVNDESYKPSKKQA